MNKIFWGLLFLLININIGGVSITPSFVGYILIYFGMKQMEVPETFKKARLWIVAGGVLNLLFWLPVWGEGLNFLVSFVGALLHVTVTYEIVQAVNEERDRQNTSLDTNGLHKAWVVTAVCEILAIPLVWLGGWLTIIISFVAAIVYIAAFNECKKVLGE